MDQQHQKKLAETLRQLRLIVVKFADDCVHAFPEIARAHEAVFRYYLKFGSAGDQEVFAVYDFMCRKYPERATLIWMRDAQLFDSDFIAHHGLGDCELLPRLDFRHLYFATPTDEAREHLWLYIQGMLMLTLNECNRHLAEMQERSRKSLEDFFEINGDRDSDAGSAGADGSGSGSGQTPSMASLFQMMDSEDYQQQIEDIVNRLNAHFASASDAADDADDGDKMDTEGEGDDRESSGGGAGNAFPAFDSEHIKQFMGTLTDTKFGRLAHEVVTEFMQRHPELADTFRELEEKHRASGSSGAGRMSTMTVIRFLLGNKCLSMKELFALMSERLRQKLHAGEFTMEELRKEFPKFMQSLSKMSNRDVQELVKASGAKGRVDTSRLQRELAKEQTKDRMRQNLLEKKRRETDALIKLSTGMISGFDAADAYDHLRGCNLSEARAGAGGGSLSHEEQQRMWKQSQEEVLALFADNTGVEGGGSGGGGGRSAHRRVRKQGKR